jgi:hypothetical protein
MLYQNHFLGDQMRGTSFERLDLGILPETIETVV